MMTSRALSPSKRLHLPGQTTRTHSAWHVSRSLQLLLLESSTAMTSSWRCNRVTRDVFALSCLLSQCVPLLFFFHLFWQLDVVAVFRSWMFPIHTCAYVASVVIVGDGEKLRWKFWIFRATLFKLNDASTLPHRFRITCCVFVQTSDSCTWSLEKDHPLQRLSRSSLTAQSVYSLFCGSCRFDVVVIILNNYKSAYISCLF